MKRIFCVAILMLCLGKFAQSQYSSFVFSQPYKSAGYSLAVLDSATVLLATGPGVLFLDSTGNQQGYNRYLSTGVSLAKIRIASNGDLLILFQQSSIGAGNGDIIFFRTDSTGTIQWIRTYGTSSKEIPMDFIETANGDIYILSTVQNFSGSNNVIVLSAIGSGGNQLWQRSYISPVGAATAQAICFGADSNVYIIGNGLEGGILLKTNISGVLQMSLAYAHCRLESLISDSQSNNLYLCGSYSDVPNPDVSNAFIIRQSYNGNVIWKRILDNSAGVYSSEAYCIELHPDTHQIICGGKVLVDTITTKDYQALSMIIDTSASLQSTFAYGGAGQEYFRDVISLSSSRLIWAGYSSSYGDSNILVVYTDASGNPHCGGNSFVPLWSDPVINNNAAGFVMDTGNLNVVTYCYPPIPETLTSYKICMSSGIAQNINEESALNIFPNPCKNLLEVTIEKIDDKQIKINLINTLGQLQRHWEFQANDGALKVQLSMQGIPSGVYFLWLNSEHTSSLQKVLVSD